MLPLSSKSPAHHVQAFVEALQRPPSAAALFRAAVLVTPVHQPTLAPGWEREVEAAADALVEKARLELPPRTDGSLEAVEAFSAWFVDGAGFTGNQANYHAPENSCLGRVIATRQGLPITLSILLVHLAEQLGLQCYGVGTPGHFLTGTVLSDGRTRYLDPFHGGSVLTEDEALELVRQRTGLAPAQLAGFLRPAPPRDVLARVLNNLKVAYSNRGDLEALVRTLDWLIALDGRNLGEVRNRGLLLLRLGSEAEGARDLLHYLRQAPEDADDREVIREEAERALRRRRDLN